MRFRLQVVAPLVLTLAGMPAPARADDERPPRPKVALVLSGGGARGAAHVGVLEVLEEQRVPVDLIVGTSIGAVVGGLYASGFSPQEIALHVRDTDWDDLLSDRLPRKNISFRRKQDDRRPLFQFELGVNRDGITLPAGLIAGQKLSFELRTMTLHTTGIDDFDRLPIPFRAVATDLDTGELVVLARGDLAEAMRASMSVPGAFTPVRWGGRTLVDGGLVMNLPVTVARELGAERIIAVDVSTPIKHNTDRSVVGVAVQTLGVLTDLNVREQRRAVGPDDILLTPALDDFQVGDFERAAWAMERGAEAARERLGDLAALTVPPEQFGEYMFRQRLSDARRLSEMRLDELEIVGVRRVAPEIVRRRLHTRPGQRLDLETLRADLNRIYRIGEFQQVDFRIERSDGRDRLVIDAQEKSWGPRYLRFGLGLEANFEGQGEFVALANYTWTQLNDLGAEWKSFLQIGDTDSIFTELFQPLHYAGYWFVAPQLGYVRDQNRFRDETGARLEADTQRVSARLDVGVQFRNYGEIRVGGLIGSADSEIRSETGMLDLEVDIGGFIGQVTLDQLDNANFPRQGVFGEVEAFLSRDVLGADDDYERLAIRLTEAGSIGRHTLVSQQRFGTDLGSEAPFYDEFRLGGFLNLSGLAPGELQGDVLAYVNLIYFNRVGQLPRALGGGVYLGAALEAANVWSDVDLAEPGDLRPAGLVFGGADTVLGPLYLGYGRADGGDDSFYLFLGQLF